MTVSESTVRAALAAAVSRFRGPGGAIAVLQDGALIQKQTWGYADLDLRIPMTAQTAMPVCSITKQMLCALLWDLERNPTSAMAAQGDIMEQFSSKLRQVVDKDLVQETGLTIEHLCNNQSGLRDYWAMCMLWGAGPESHFSITKHGPLMRSRLKSLQFQPGTEYSYSNTNFHLLAWIIEAVAGETIDSLLAQRVFGLAGMATAHFCQDTAQHPLPCVGYEGDEQRGFFRAVNRVEWSGDAGVVASLDDMVAYEAYLDRSLTNPQSWYAGALAPSQYRDTTPARYRRGLIHIEVSGVSTIGHSGALRGFRLHRLQAPRERLSIVVMLNHEVDAAAVAEDVLERILDLPKPSGAAVNPSPAWLGTFLDESTQLAITVAPGSQGELLITYAGYPEAITLTGTNHGESRDMIAAVNDDTLTIQRLEDNRTLRASRLSRAEEPETSTIQGVYRCTEIDSYFHCHTQGGLLFGSFDGFLGQGPAQMMRHLGDHVWALACPRGLDAPAPGDWTVCFHQKVDGTVGSVTIGCWLARKFEFEKST
ncbi:hypothetical protein NCS56_01443300 [Fusarium sp. Ph1]|nr:hypothetical protein NCS56_01443300 [Fusarium sp. Ph1]